MLKHATPRSSPSLSTTGSCCSSSSSSSRRPERSRRRRSASSENAAVTRSKSKEDVSFNERSVDCEGIRATAPLLKKGLSLHGLNNPNFLNEAKILLGASNVSEGIGPVITHGKAIVRRGLSFTRRKDADVSSLRSVKSEDRTANGIPQWNRLQSKASSEATLKVGQNSRAAKAIGDIVSGDHKTTSQDDHGMARTTSKERNSEEGKVNRREDLKRIYGPSKNDHPSLKSLLRLPGVYGHIPVPEGGASGPPHVLNLDSLSLNSSDSFFNSNSGRTSSRSWISTTSSNSNGTSDSSISNNSSTSEPTSTTLKVYAKCLRSDIDYKTVNISSRMTCRQLIHLLLAKARMKYTDPNLFYLTMEVTVRRWSGAPVRALLVLEESAKPSQLSLCRPSGDLRFVLQMNKGGIIKVHDTVLMPGSQYKSLLVSHRTTADETVQLLLNCYPRRENKNHFALHQVCQFPEYRDRRLNQKERPLDAKAEWPKDQRAQFVFVLRRNMSQVLSLRKFCSTTTASSENDDKLDHRSKEGRQPVATNLLQNQLVLDFTQVMPTVTTVSMGLQLPSRPWINSNPIKDPRTKAPENLTIRVNNSSNNGRSKIQSVELYSRRPSVSRPIVSTRDLIEEFHRTRYNGASLIEKKSRAALIVGLNPKPPNGQIKCSTLSSSAQTELTCIPIKRNSGWNVAESFTSSSKNCQQRLTPGQYHCQRNCPNCFYI